MTHPPDAALGRDLILDELFDLTLYRWMRRSASGPLAHLLDELIVVEAKHFDFWVRFFHQDVRHLDLGRRVKLLVLGGACRLLGAPAVHLVLDGIEIYGIRKYLKLWDLYRGQPLGQALSDVLKDEFEHEDVIVSRIAERRLNPERVRSIFLGFNDGLVEILGAVSGFFAALRDPSLVLAAGASVAVAGAISMGAGAYAAGSSEQEIRKVQRGKDRFLGRDDGGDPSPDHPVRTALIVATSYLFGAVLPIAPVLAGAKTPTISIVFGATAAVLVSTILAFLSGMRVRRRILLNVGIVALALGVSTVIGHLSHRLWGI